MIKNSRPTTTCKTLFLKVSGMVMKGIWYTPLGDNTGIGIRHKIGNGSGKEWESIARERKATGM